MKTKTTLLITFVLTVLLFPLSIHGQTEATTGANSIRERVREKLEAAQNKPKAFLGTITDLTDSTIQIQDDTDLIKQIKADEESTAFVKDTDGKEEIEYDEVAIGDYIVAMGYVDENNILNALRVLISQEPAPPQRSIHVGTVESIEGKTLTLGQNSSEIIEAVFPRRWKGPEISEITEGDEVIIVIINDEGVTTIRTVEITSD